MRILLTITPQEAAKTDVTDDEYDTELTQLASSATEHGVNEITTGDKNLDTEFQPAAKSANNTKSPLRPYKSKKTKKSKKKAKKSRK